MKLKSHIDEELHLSPIKHDVSQDHFNDSDDTLLINEVEQYVMYLLFSKFLKSIARI